MKKTFFINIFILITILSIVSCWKNTKDNEAELQKNTEKTLNLSWSIIDWTMLEKNAPKVEESISKISEKLKAEPSYRACIARASYMCSSEVISSFTHEKDSDEACNIFEDLSLKTSCINAINTELARKKIDISYCAKLDSQIKVNCEQQVIIAQAIKEKDVTICNKLIEIKTNTPTISDSLLPNPIEESNNQCVMQVIMALDITKKDLKICETLKNDIWKQNCISIIKSNIEMQKNNSVIPPI